MAQRRSSSSGQQQSRTYQPQARKGGRKILRELSPTQKGKSMSWIKTVPYSNATGKLKKLYDRVKGPDNNIDNIMMLHSLRPHSMEGHMAIYKYVLHHSGNKIPKWFLEALGVWVSSLNECNYCVDHHFAGMKRLLGVPSRMIT